MPKKETTNTKTNKNNYSNYIGMGFSTDPISRTAALRKFVNVINEFFEEPIIKITQRNIVSILKELSNQITNDSFISEESSVGKKISEVSIHGPEIPEEDDKEGEYSLNSSCYIATSNKKDFIYIFLEDDSYDKGKKGGKITIQFDTITNKKPKSYFNYLMPNKNSYFYNKISKICQDNDIHINYIFYK